MAKAEKLSSGNWRIRVYLGKDENGKKIQKSITAPTKRQAEAEAAIFLLQHKEKENQKITVGQAIDEYINIKENVLSPTTIRCYRKYREKWLQGLMDVPIADLDSQLLQREINKESVFLSPKSLRNAYGLLNAAVKMHSPNFFAKVTMPAKEHKIKELPEPEEVMKAVKGDEIELPCLLGMWLSLRMSEIRGIKFSDMNGNVLTIQRTIVTFDGQHIEKEQTKTYNSTRKHVIPAEIMKLIQAERTKAQSEDEYLVKQCGQTISKRFTRLLERSGVKRMTFHELRHLNASVMLMLGIPDKYAMERGGWSTSDTLKNVYQHTFSKKRLEVDKKIDDYFSQIYKSVD